MKPSRRLLALLAALFGLALLLGTLDALGQALTSLHGLWWGLLLSLALAAGLDAWRLRRLPSPEVSRTLPGNLPLGHWSEVQVHLRHGYAQALRLAVFDHLPATMQHEHLPQQITLRPGEQASLSYRVWPTQRGHFVFALCELLLPSPLGLWQSRRLLAVQDETRVYPDFARLYGAELMAVEDWLSQLGVRQQPRRGLGQAFHQLREYREGDTLRQIDWKATARMRTPITREYQDERDQQIVFLLDGGRRMRSRDGELSHFDHALNAALLLSYVALRQGDAVGLLTFAQQQPRFLPPAKGNGQLNHLLNSVYDLEASQLPADFSAAASQLLARQQRRALVIILSNLRDEDDEELQLAVHRLGRQHRVLVASLREEVLDQVRQAPVEDLDSALSYCGAVDYLNARNALHERLAARQVPVLDARPSELGPALINRYLAWKKAGVL
ncbi:Uncharacterized conserved protein, DUF58 family, contains vWF domain [Pseudomonas cuatrocienegasensis]|uniref:Uncharacterized conserved protein, DUF58 family, contains vWF domain n=1 Tax=Pseudomonas cuatrocienegasensis TaxID=543360 RepID=A0ABY1BCX2_9PSED|nr:MULTISPECIES: DUF58 domain-containing protein [Pseudomonas]OEC33593.1 hypothetical protein A7D25_17805 [Pseudomonas sp. 21C1]SEQ56406.1 Uncharacterized conserved protein, DUF58 family, contains vWF domain [Pseudomonas cuatrocienegasensis]